MTAGDLADRLGQSRQNLSNKMKRDNYSEAELRAIASALDCSVEVQFTIQDTGEKL